MIRKSILVILTLILCMITVSAVCAEENHTFNDVQSEIAKADSLVNLSGTYTGEDMIEIDKSITIQGHNNTVLDAEKKTNIVVAAGDVTFKDITFANGNSQDKEVGGGAVLIAGKGTFINCVFINNHAKTFGGAIAGVGELVLKNCTFIANSAGNGGSVFQMYDADSNRGSLTITDCRFENNTADENAGAVMSALIGDDDTTGRSVIETTEFINNRAGCCGAIYSYADLSINRCEFTDNKAVGFKGKHYSSSDEGYGAALEVYSGKAVIKNSLFSRNTAKYGSIRITDSKVTFTNNTLTDNSNPSVFFGDVESEFGSDIAMDDNLSAVKLFKHTASTLKSTTYNSGKTITLKLINTLTGEGVSNFNVAVVDGKNVMLKTTNSKGIITLKASTLSYGTHKLQIYLDEIWYPADKVTTTVKVNKAPTRVKAPKVTNRYKKSQYFKVTVKAYKKPIKKLKLKVKVYTGKKSKTYTITTDKNGVAKLNTKALKIGTHKVVITSGNSNYKVSAKSSIKIRW